LGSDGVHGSCGRVRVHGDRRYNVSAVAVYFVVIAVARAAATVRYVDDVGVRRVVSFCRSVL
jgi:hypothetical protein